MCFYVDFLSSMDFSANSANFSLPWLTTLSIFSSFSRNTGKITVLKTKYKLHYFFFKIRIHDPIPKLQIHIFYVKKQYWSNLSQAHLFIFSTHHQRYDRNFVLLLISQPITIQQGSQPGKYVLSLVENWNICCTHWLRLK